MELVEHADSRGCIQEYLHVEMILTVSLVRAHWTERF